MKLPIIITILFFLQSYFQPIFATTSPKAYQDFITTSCSSTTYPSLCNEYLSSYAAKVKNNPLKLCNAALTVSLQAAKNSSTTLSSFSKQKGISKRDTGVIKDCIYNIKDSVEKIKESINELGSFNNCTNKKFQLDTIKTYVSVAITDEETCVDELGDSNLSASVKNKIKCVIVNFERITSNALYLVNHLNI